jgi:hypothetical protein
MDGGDDRKGCFFETWTQAPLAPLFVGVPGTALRAPQPLPNARTTRAKIA